MKTLIVHAHPELDSFSSALFRHAVEIFEKLGHEVMVSDLYAIKFDPVSDRRNFTSVKNSEYLKQQEEELYASKNGGFIPALDEEMKKLEKCDLLIFNFPLWWFGMPAILKGYVDRVFAYGRIYGLDKLYENGLGQSKKRALVIMTTGGGPDVYSGYGVNPPLNTILAPIQHGVFWFNGFLPLEPFVAWSAARVSDEQRGAYLQQLEARLQNIQREKPFRLPKLGDFPGWGKDSQKRFMTIVSLKLPIDERFKALIPRETEKLAELKRDGFLLSSYIGVPQGNPWRGFLLFRETTADAVAGHLQSLPLAPYLQFETIELNQT